MSMSTIRVGGIIAALSAVGFAAPALARTQSAEAQSRVVAGTALETITVTGQKTKIAPNSLPQTGESLTGAQIAQTINVLDAEDTLKYLPGLFVRKRNKS